MGVHCAKYHSHVLLDSGAVRPQGLLFIIRSSLHDHYHYKSIVMLHNYWVTLIYDKSIKKVSLCFQFSGTWYGLYHLTREETWDNLILEVEKTDNNFYIIHLNGDQ